MILRTTRRDLLRYGSLSALAASPPAPAIAQAWPTKPIRIVCTYPAGGLTDIFARAYGEYVAEKTGQPVIVENKAGAAGAIGAEIVKQSPARRLHADVHQFDDDGAEQGAVQEAPYDPDKDFALVAWFNTGHLPTMVNKDIPVKDIPEFAAWARTGGLARHLRHRLRAHRHGDAEPPLRAQDGTVHYRGEALMWQDVASGAAQGATGSRLARRCCRRAA